jgi:pimeloyl-ACP methyl ester carboxylesterase
VTTAGRHDDEFRLLADNAREAGLDWSGSPRVRRIAVEVAPGRDVSAVLWGRGPPELVLLHGGGQNAHTWDTVALALGRPLLAVDLPGHGHSAWRDDGDYRPAALGADIAVVVRQLAPSALVVAGMSLGGLAALSLACDHPELVAQLVLVDVTPGIDGPKVGPVLAFLSGPSRFASLEEMVERTVAFNPTRSRSSLRRGVIHNARAFADGTWGWRWDPGLARPDRLPLEFSSLWAAVEAARVPLLLVRGALSPVVSDDDVAELLRRQPQADVELVVGAGHSIQGDQPLALARILRRLLDG